MSSQKSLDSRPSCRTPDAPTRFLKPTSAGFAVFCGTLFAIVRAGALHAADGMCPTDGTTPGRVISVNERLELTLEDGSQLKIAGIDAPRPTPDDPDLDTTARDRLTNWLAGRDIMFRPIGAGPDRWGRIVAFVFASAPEQIGPESARMPLGEAVIDAGLARYEAGAAARPCRAALLAAETGARASGLGLWADPYYAIIAASDRQSFAEKAGTSVIVEGRVAGVENRGSRTILSFGPRQGWGFSVRILPRNMKIFDAAGLSLAAFAGKTVRVRGLLDTHFGPHIEISNPDEVELIGQAQDATATLSGSSTLK